MGDGGDSGYGSVMKWAIFSIVFVAVFALLSGGMSNVINGDTRQSSEMDSKTFGAEEYAGVSWWSYSGATGFGINMTGDNDFIGPTGIFGAPSPAQVALANYNPLGAYFQAPNTDADPLEWTYGDVSGIHSLKLYTFNGGEWIAYRQGGGWDRWWTIIEPGDIITAARQLGDGSSSASVKIDVGVKATLVFSFPKNQSVSDALANNGPYNVAVGQTLLDSSFEVGDVWTIAGQLLTFSLHTTGVWYVDYIASTVVWAGLIMVGFYMINRLLDHIPFT